MKTKNCNNFSFKKKTKKQFLKNIILGGGVSFEINFIPKKINVTLIYNADSRVYEIEEDSVMMVGEGTLKQNLKKTSDTITITSDKMTITSDTTNQKFGSVFDYENYYIVQKKNDKNEYNDEIKKHIEFGFIEFIKILILKKKYSQFEKTKNDNFNNLLKEINNNIDKYNIIDNTEIIANKYKNYLKTDFDVDVNIANANELCIIGVDQTKQKMKGQSYIKENFHQIIKQIRDITQRHHRL